MGRVRAKEGAESKGRSKAEEEGGRDSKSGEKRRTYKQKAVEESNQGAHGTVVIEGGSQAVLLGSSCSTAISSSLSPLSLPLCFQYRMPSRKGVGMTPSCFLHATHSHFPCQQPSFSRIQRLFTCVAAVWCLGAWGDAIRTESTSSRPWLENRSDT
jgi:hypothetical protein